MVWRLAKEVRKTQRRVNALEKIVIPDVEETRKFIEGVLEEAGARGVLRAEDPQGEAAGRQGMKALLQTVVVAVSGSEASINAAKYAHRDGQDLPHAVSSPSTSWIPRRCKELLMSKIFVEDESAEYEKSLEQNGQRYLNYVAELAAEEGRAGGEGSPPRSNLH